MYVYVANIIVVIQNYTIYPYYGINLIVSPWLDCFFLMFSIFRFGYHLVEINAMSNTLILSHFLNPLIPFGSRSYPLFNFTLSLLKLN